MSALSFNANSFDDNLHTDKNNSDVEKNPFFGASTTTPSKESPNKRSLFQKSSEMMMVTKSNRYDVFKNELATSPFSGQIQEPAPPAIPHMIASKTDPDLFKDFAVAAFKEFKIDKTQSSSSLHEFSNKLSDAQSFQKSSMKVNSTAHLLC